MTIYVASSWKNQFVTEAVARLRGLGHDVYDFRDPVQNGETGFHWSEVEKDWAAWKADRFRQALHDPRAVKGFARDMLALERADACVLVCPCGRSAHLELGYAVGAGKAAYVLIPDPDDFVPELMYKMTGGILIGFDELESVFRPDPAPSGSRMVRNQSIALGIGLSLLGLSPLLRHDLSPFTKAVYFSACAVVAAYSVWTLWRIGRGAR